MKRDYFNRVSILTRACVAPVIVMGALLAGCTQYQSGKTETKTTKTTSTPNETRTTTTKTERTVESYPE